MKIHRNPPVNLRDNDEELFKKSAYFDVKEPAVLTLKNVFICWQGQVFKKFKIYTESLSTDLFLYKYNSWMFLKSLISSLLQGKLKHLKHQCMVIHDEWSSNYFHWMTDAITRLHLARDFIQETVLILPESFKSDYYEFIFKCYGVKKIFYTKPGIVLFAKRLILPEHTAPAGNYHPVLIRNAVDILLSKTSATVRPWNRIYISRKKATVRRVMNEWEVQNVLLALGFTIIYMEDLLMKDKIKLMQETMIVVSLHGAGLTNMMFMKPGTAILELRNEDSSEIYNCYHNLAAVFDIQYYYLTCKGRENSLPGDADLEVSLHELKQTCRMMMDQMDSASITGS